MDKHRARIAVVVCFFNAGITTRGLKIAKAISKQDASVDIRFFSWNHHKYDDSTYESVIRDAGFPITFYGKPLSRAEWNHILEAEQSGQRLQTTEFFEERISECKMALQEYKPDIVVHGVMPDCAVASQLLRLKSVQYRPIPVDRDFFRKQITDIPDVFKGNVTRYLPHFVTKMLFQWIHPRHNRLSPVVQAALRSGWKPRSPSDLNVFSTSTCILVTDLPRFYRSETLPPSTKVIGPVFADDESSEQLPPDVEELITRSAHDGTKKPHVFITMGSSGDRKSIAEAVKAVCDRECYAIVALPPCRCTVAELQCSISIPKTLVVLDSFVPARRLAAWSDVVICHGGQGTCQPALAAGSPMVGVGLQFEQEWNLENIVQAGAAIRLPKWQWKGDKIWRAVEQVTNDESYKQAAKEIADEIASFESAEEAARTVLEILAGGNDW